MRLEWPLALLALLAIPLVLGIVLAAERRRARYAVRFTNLDVLAAVAERSGRWRQRLPLALALLALVLLAAALARPHVAVSAPREQATIVLVIDTSGSMMATDVKPTRLAAAQAAVRAFLDKVPKSFRVGIVSFSTDPQVVAPPTTDRELLGEALDYLSFGFRTAIGDAIERAVQLSRETLRAQGDGGAPSSPSEQGGRPLAAVLLLSDGYQNWGQLQPLQAAQRARARGVPVYTVALGTPDGVLIRDWGGERRVIPVPPDPETLRAVARTTGAQAFEARSAERLKTVYERLGSRLGRVKEDRETTAWFIGGGAVALALAFGLSLLWAPRLP